MAIKGFLAAVIFLAVSIVCGWQLWGINHNYAQELRTKTNMLAYKPDESPPGEYDPPEEAGSEEEIGKPPPVNPWIEQAKAEVNADIDGWIVIPDTGIDYAFVEGSDNSYYLNHDIEGKTSTAGSIFLDYRCADDLSDFNNILYGHSMKNGSMFGSLKSFNSEGFFSQHNNGELRLQDRTFNLEIFAVLVVNNDDPLIYGIPSEWTDTAKVEFLDYAKANARYYRETDFEPGDKVLELSTCAYEFQNARLVVLAKISG